MSGMIKYSPKSGLRFDKYAAGNALLRMGQQYAARKIQQKYRSWNRKPSTMVTTKRKSYSQTKALIGMPTYSLTGAKCVTIQNDLTPQVRNTRTLHFVNLCNIAQGTTIAQRLRQTLNISGFRITGEVAAVFDSTLGPVYFNHAVIAPKANSTIVSTDFFRGHSSTRAQSFSTALTGHEFHLLEINTDDYTVLTHRRRIVARADTATSGFTWDPNRPSYFNVNEYVKLNRQVRWTIGGNTPTDGIVFHVFWCDRFGAPSGEVAVPAITTTLKYITYFREPA